MKLIALALTLALTINISANALEVTTSQTTGVPSANSNAYEKMNTKFLAKLMQDLADMQDRIAKIEKCTAKQSFYDPTHSKADSNGCYAPPAITVTDSKGLYSDFPDVIKCRRATDSKSEEFLYISYAPEPNGSYITYANARDWSHRISFSKSGKYVTAGYNYTSSCKGKSLDQLIANGRGFTFQKVEK